MNVLDYFLIIFLMVCTFRKSAGERVNVKKGAQALRNNIIENYKRGGKYIPSLSRI